MSVTNFPHKTLQTQGTKSTLDFKSGFQDNNMQLKTKGVLNRKYEDFELETEDSVVVIEKKKINNDVRKSYDPQFGSKMVKSLSPRARYENQLNYPGTSSSLAKQNKQKDNVLSSNLFQREAILSAQ